MAFLTGNQTLRVTSVELKAKYRAYSSLICKQSFCLYFECGNENSRFKPKMNVKKRTLENVYLCL